MIKVQNLESGLSPEQVRDLVAQACVEDRFRNKKVLVIIPDGTRTAPVGLLFKAICDQIADWTTKLDILVALGTHQPMTEAAICERLEITQSQRQSTYRSVEFFNHAWDDPNQLTTLGIIPESDISRLSDGRFAMDVKVQINKRVLDYDQLIIIGPVFPHEVVGFSGGNKYLFPGVSGPEILNFFHWLGAVVSNPKIIGNKWTPVRKVVDRAGAMVPVEKLCFCLVVDKCGLAGCFAGTPELAWDAASDLSDRLHVIWKDRPYKRILSCSPPMYDELWTGGKCMYKLEPVLADGGELIIYAPHISEVCVTHGKVLHEVGYHCRDYFIKQWEAFKHHPWGVLAHSCHVYGQGVYENGIESPRARVTLATGIPEDVCKHINLGYRDPASINPSDFMDREDEGILYVPKAGEMLYKLKSPPDWARG